MIAKLQNVRTVWYGENGGVNFRIVSLRDVSLHCVNLHIVSLRNDNLHCNLFTQISTVTSKELSHNNISQYTLISMKFCDINDITINLLYESDLS